jgi:hypothetical protein
VVETQIAPSRVVRSESQGGGGFITSQTSSKEADFNE